MGFIRQVRAFFKEDRAESDNPWLSGKAVIPLASPGMGITAGMNPRPESFLDVYRSGKGMAV